MSTQILSAVVPDSLAARVRRRADVEERSVSNSLRRLIADALENDNGPAASEAEVKTGAGTPDGDQE